MPDSGVAATGAVQSSDMGRMMRPAVSWGFWATLFFTVLIIAGWYGIQVLASGILVVVTCAFGLQIPLDHMGFLLAFGTCLGLVADVGGAILFAAMLPGVRVRDYLHLRPPVRSRYFPWCVAILLFAAASDGVTTLLGRPIIPEAMYEAYTTAGWLPLMWCAIIVAAPIGEEIVFRGFMFEGIRRSSAGPVGAVLLPSLAWSALHVQYDWYGLATVFVGGLVLGAARLKTESLYVPILMHAIWGVVATVEMDVWMRMLAG